MTEMVKCDCCGINTATKKDNREHPSGSYSIQPWVCIHCLNLNNYWFFKLMNAEDQGKRNLIIEELLTDNDFTDRGLKSWL